jgi:hypothetical protein
MADASSTRDEFTIETFSTTPRAGPTNHSPGAKNPSSTETSRSARRESQFEQVLLACALAEKDELGYFTASAVRDPLSRIMGKRYEIPAFARHLNQFSEPVRGQVLQKTGESNRYFYRFTNPLLQPFVILNGLAHDLISEELIVAVQNGAAPPETCC